MATKFKNLADIYKAFPDEKTCREHLEQLRWSGNPVCPHCGTASKPYKLSNGKQYKCSDKDCKQKFTVTVGTIFEGTKVPLQKWFLSLYVVTSHKKGISSLQLSRDIGVTQTTAWFILHRIRTMLASKAPAMLEGIVEIDETYIGGNFKNKHRSKRLKKNADGKLIRGRGTPKPAVLGLLQRDGQIVQQTIDGTTHGDLLPIIEKHVKKGSVMVTDELNSYRMLKKLGYKHESIAHKYDEFYRDGWHTNSIEGAFGILKRCIIGTWHSISAKHLQKYVDETSYRYNTRKEKNEAKRFDNSITQAEGKRLKYKDLIRKR